MLGAKVVVRPSYNAAKAKLIKAALGCVMDEGMEGATARKIALRAGVAVGLINYHFPSIKDLMAAAYTQLAFDMLEPAISKSEGEGENAREQLSIFIEETFSAPVLRKEVLRAWVAFWSMIDVSPQIRNAHDQTNSAFRDYVEMLFVELTEQGRVTPTPRLAAIGLTAIVDGLWLEYCLAPDSFTRKEAIRLCEQWIDGAWGSNA